MNYKFIFRQSATSISGFAKIGLKTINNYSFVISSDVSPLQIDGEFIFTFFAGCLQGKWRVFAGCMEGVCLSLLSNRSVREI